MGNSDHVVVSVSVDFPSNSKRDNPFHRIAYDYYSRADWDGLRDHLKDIPLEDIFQLGASAEFWEWVQVWIGVYIPHRKYQVKPHLSPWLSAACAAAIVHRNHFFRLHQQNKSSESKVKLRLVIVAKGSLKLPNLHIQLKQKSPSLPRNLALGIFGELLIVFSTKVNLLYFHYSTVWRCCFLHLIKQNCLLKTFLRTLIFEKLANNRIVDHLVKCLFFLIFSVVVCLLDQLQILWQLYLIEMLGPLKGLGLLKHLIYPRLSAEFGMLVFFTNWSFMEFPVRYFALFLLFSVIEGFGWFWMGGLHKNKQLMLESLRGPFLVLHISY